MTGPMGPKLSNDFEWPHCELDCFIHAQNRAEISLPTVYPRMYSEMSASVDRSLASLPMITASSPSKSSSAAATGGIEMS